MLFPALASADVVHAVRHAALGLAVLALAVLPCSASVSADPPEPFLFADLNDSLLRDGSRPEAVGTVGGVTLFTAESDSHGRELWRTDGTPRGTFLLADFCSGRCSSRVTLAAEDGRFLLLWVGRGLWRTDGTVDGTFLLHQGDGLPSEGAWSAPLGRLVFLASDEAAGREPWVSDGTAAGTRRLADLWEGPAGSEPRGFRVVDGLVYFRASDGESGTELWRTDGTRPGTRRVTDLAPGPEHGVTSIHGPLDGRLLLLKLQTRGFELWTFEAGDEPRKLLGFDAGSHGVATVADDGRRLLMVLQVEGRGLELWSSNGTPDGTGRLMTVGAEPGEPVSLGDVVAAGEQTIFFPFLTPYGREPWSTDGTAAGTRLLADTCPGSCSSGRGRARSLGSRAVLVLDDGLHGREPWGTDGAPAGTLLLGDLCPGPCSGGLEPVSPRGYLAAPDGKGGQVLWRTDGTPQGTVSFGEALEGLEVVSDSPGAVLLAGHDGLTGWEPWWMDETSGDLRPLGDLLRGVEAGSWPEGLVRAKTAVGERLFFLATGSDGVRTVWMSDGTPSDTRPVPEAPSLAPTFGWVEPPARLEAGAGGVFLVAREEEGATLWWSDGVIPMRRLARVEVGSRTLDELVLAADEARLFLLAEELWVSDGTVEGTRRLWALSPVAGPRHSVLVDGRFYFVAEVPDPVGGAAGAAIWRSDGTLSGTGPWFRHGSWQSREAVGEMVADGTGGLWFAADRDDRPDLLWRSDGAPEGTRVVPASSDPAGTTLPSEPRRLIPAGDRLFFIAGSGRRSSWWVTDGTGVGTRDLQVRPRTPSSQGGPEEAVFRGELVFVGEDRDLYRTEGARAVPFRFAFPQPPRYLEAAFYGALDRLFVTTRESDSPWRLWMLEDLSGTAELVGSFPDALHDPRGFTGLGSRVFFAGPDPDLSWDDELLALDLAAPPPPRPGEVCTPGPGHLCLLDGRFRVRVDWRNPHSGDVGTAGAAPFPGSSRTGTFWFFHPANVELIVKVLDGRPVNGFHWTFYGALTDVEYWVDVEDLETGWTRTYHKPPHQICGRADTGTFETGWTVASSAGGPATAPPRVRHLAAREIPACTDPGVLCLRDGRFRLEVAWRDPRSGDTGTGTAVVGTGRTGYFWFFRDDNVELAAKVLDGTPVNGHHWVFWGALTDVEYDLRVVDAEAGVERTYRNPPGNVCGGADTAAFPTP